MPPNKYFLWTRILLTLGGCTLSCAAVPIFFTPDLMESFHRALGLGSFPDQPITIYLAKSTSMLYALHGAVILFVAFQFQRFHPWVPFLAWLHVALGIGLVYIDATSGMPWWWLAIEGPPVTSLGLVLVILYGKGIRQASK
jgi:hypothetical protein